LLNQYQSDKIEIVYIKISPKQLSKLIGGINMTSAAQRAELQSQIWKIANDVRGSVDGWDFKQYVLGTLFYRFISVKFF
jgi:Type I restriction-modification system methyltransferase subunit